LLRRHAVEALAARDFAEAMGRDPFVLCAMRRLAVTGIADHHPVPVGPVQVSPRPSISHGPEQDSNESPVRR